jgi:phospholipase/carboxylesterase
MGLALTHRISVARTGNLPHPTLLLLHGLGSNEDDLLSMAPELDPRVLIISARAPFAYRWGGFMWYDLEQHGPGLGSASIEEGLGLLRRFVKELLEEYPVDPQRLYLGGFSMGAAMAGGLALLEPESVAGAIMISGYLPPDPRGDYRTQDAAGRPFFQAHGTVDPVVPIEAARATRDYLSQSPVDLTYREYPIGHEMSYEELRDLTTWFSGVLDASEPRSSQVS